jgi:asparagine synthase (glutamine-hydrolysing)
LFGGYAIYREPAAVAPVQRCPAAVRRALRALAGVLPEGLKGKGYLTRATTPIEERYYGNARIFDGAEKRTVLRGRPTASRMDLTAGVYAATTGLDDVSRMQTVDLLTWLPGDILTKADRMSMAHSLELRVPFLDPAVYGVARRIPAGLRVPRGRRVTKYLLREAVRGIVPDVVADRPKSGFATPTRVWLRSELNDWAHDVLSRSGAGDLVDLAYVRGLLVAHERRQADHSRKVWTVLMFCLWHAVFVERSLDPLVGSAADRR